MARRNSSNAETSSNPNIPQVPEGYAEVAEDIVGFWNPDIYHLIHVVPKEAKVFDNKVDPTRVSTLILAKLVDAALLSAKDDDKQDITVEGKPGDMIGIWGKPGLRQKLMNMANKDCFICPNGEKDVGRPQPMKLFSVRAKGTGGPLPLVEDRRDKSKGAETWWSFPNVSDEDDDSIPF